LGSPSLLLLPLLLLLLLLLLLRLLLHLLLLHHSPSCRLSPRRRLCPHDQRIPQSVLALEGVSPAVAVGRWPAAAGAGEARYAVAAGVLLAILLLDAGVHILQQAMEQCSSAAVHWQ
jgi:hypothetical protein